MSGVSLFREEPGLLSEFRDGTRAALERVYRAYYFSPRYIWKSVKKMARDPKEGARMLGEGKEFIVSMIKRRQIEQTPARSEAPAQA